MPHIDPLFVFLLFVGIVIAVVTHWYTKRTDPTVAANQTPRASPPPSERAPLSPEEYARQTIALNTLIVCGGTTVLYDLANMCGLSAPEMFLSLWRMHGDGYIRVIDRRRVPIDNADKTRLLVHILPKGREWVSSRRDPVDPGALQSET